jgi:hypothetical protein
MPHRRARLAFWKLYCLLLGLSSATASAAVLDVTLNGLKISIDRDTGSVVALESPEAGVMLQADARSAGIIDVAYPVESFTAMRLASRFSQAEVKVSNREITITWHRLGPSRSNLALPSGAVSAQVRIRAADDGRSIIWRAHLDNGSGAAVAQILFPDLAGLKPFDGVDDTRLRLAGATVLPFQGPVGGDPGRPYFERQEWKRYSAGGYYEPHSLRWLDFGSHRAGMSLFQRKWGSDDRPNILTHRTERDPTSLRLAWEHTQPVEPGQMWDSGEFWLTPHSGGWAKGIEVYRDYVRQVTPARSVAAHVRDDVGYLTIWMIQTAEVDPAKAAFRFQDLPKVALDASRYGIHEVVPWGWNTYSTLPIPVRGELGTVDDLMKAVSEARSAGVNIAPFISVTIVRNRYASRYGVQPSNDDWTYHSELVPMFRPYYTKFWNGVEIDDANSVWRQDVTEALTQWINRGLTSFSWDVFRERSHDGKRPEILPMIENVRALARAKYPQSTFSGESVTSLEWDSEVLDYLWNWRGYEDAAPITNVLRLPRINCNVELSALEIDKCFADNLYLNVMPRKPDEPNGTSLISDIPELGAALTRVSKLRRQFLPYFVNGTLIGDSVLSRPAEAFVRGYQGDGKLLVIVLNDHDTARAVDFQSDVSLWLPKSAAYDVSAYDGAGTSLGSSRISGPKWFGVTRQLEPGGMEIFEVGSARPAK